MQVQIKVATILSLIHNFHEGLKKSINVVNNEKKSNAKRQAELIQLIDLLKALWKAEEGSLYQVLLKKEHSQTATYDAIEDHAIAFILIEDLEALDYKNRWNTQTASKARVLAELVMHHISENENEFFKEARSVLSHPELVSLAEKFLSEYETELTDE